MSMRIPQASLTKLKQVLSFAKPGALKTDTAKTHISVKRDTRTYIERQGWTLSNGSWPPTWHGYYRTKVGSWKGMIKTTTPPGFYIFKPPEGLTTKHSHRLCFHPTPDGWCSVHFNTALHPTPRDLDSAVIKLEKILYEAYVLTQKTA